MTDPVITAKTCEFIPDLKRSFKAAARTTTQGVLQLSEDSIHLYAADPSIVGLVDLKVDPNLFETYRYDADADTVYAGTKIDTLASILSDTRKSDALTLASDRDGNLTVDITRSRGTRYTHQLPSLSLNEDDIPVSGGDLEFDAAVSMRYATFKDIVEQAADAMWMIVDDNAFKTVLQQKEEPGDDDEYWAEATVPEATLKCNVEKRVASLYSTDYLDHLRPLTQTMADITLRFGTDYPLNAGFDHGNLSYHLTLAPRLKE